MSWKKIKLGKILKQYRIEHWVQNDKLYKQVSILNDGSVVLRGEKIGKEIGRKRQFIINLDKYPETLIFTRQLLLQGCIGMASKEVNECIVTENMPMFSVEGINHEFLFYFIKSELFKAQVRDLKTSGTAQKSLHERQFLELEIPLPSDKEQKEIIKKCKLSETNFSQIVKEIESQRSQIQQLRQSILQEAVQGKFTKLNKDDDHADKLLQRINAAKQKKVNGKSKEYEYLEVQIENKYFETPINWSWCRIGEITDCLDNIREPIKKEFRNEGNIPYYGANGQVGWIDKYLFDEDLVLVVEDETFDGRTKPFSYIIRGRSWVNNHAHVLRPLGGITVEFLDLLLCRYDFVPLTSGTTGRKKLTKQGLLTAPIAIPPFSEQQRIVAKVEQLMQMINELEKQVEQGQIQAEQLLQAVLKEAFSNKGKEYPMNEVLTMAAEK